MAEVLARAIAMAIRLAGFPAAGPRSARAAIRNTSMRCSAADWFRPAQSLSNAAKPFMPHGAAGCTRRTMGSTGWCTLHHPSRSNTMKLCPIAIAVGCQKCLAFSICPLKAVIGDQAPGQPKADASSNGAKPTRGKAANDKSAR